MKIYLVKAIVDYEGFSIVGAYSERKLAEKALIILKSQEYGKGDEQEIEEMELDIPYVKDSL